MKSKRNLHKDKSVFQTSLALRIFCLTKKFFCLTLTARSRTKKFAYTKFHRQHFLKIVPDKRIPCQLQARKKKSQTESHCHHLPMAPIQSHKRKSQPPEMLTLCSAYGIRTRVPCVRGMNPRPLDESAIGEAK